LTESGQSAKGAGTARGDRQAIAAALADIQGSLAVDGYRLDIEDATGQGLSVRIVALPGACEECLAPPEVLTMIISAELDGAYLPEEIDLLSLSAVTRRRKEPA
jgi:Fe-S cluster biogenesis protein NfuA